jgi:uncharacterized protein
LKTLVFETATVFLKSAAYPRGGVPVRFRSRAPVFLGLSRSSSLIILLAPRPRDLHNSAMRPSQALENHRQAIVQIVESHNARNPRVFGSVVYGKDREDSDLDILIDPTPDTSLFDIGAIRRKLKSLLGIEVDVVTPNALPDSFRDRVLLEAKLI